MEKEKPVGAFWIKEGKGKQKFMSGTINVKEIAEQSPDIENASVILFKNTYKKPGEKSPDYRMFVGRSKKDEKPLETPPEEVTDLEPF